MVGCGRVWYSVVGCGTDVVGCGTDVVGCGRVW